MDSDQTQAYELSLAKYLESRDETMLKSAFQLLDQDGNGLVSLEDLLLFTASSPNPEGAKLQMELLFRLGDLNKDGYLDEKEYIAGIIQMHAVPEVVQDYTPSPEDLRLIELLSLYGESRDAKHLEACFRLIDSDGDGVITLEELKQSYLCKATKDSEMSARLVMRTGDLNQDGVLSLEEFIAMVGM